jgi:hypothetical protein
MIDVQIPGYRVLRTLGVGGMATVYLAEQQSLEREVALKVMSPTLANSCRPVRCASGCRPGCAWPTRWPSRATWPPG